MELATSAEQLDFPVLYTSARHGYATMDPEKPGSDMQPLFEAILNSVPAPTGDPNAPVQMLVAALDYDNYLGQVAVGRISNGTLKLRDDVALLRRNNETTIHNLERIFVFRGMEREEVSEAHAGDIVALTGPEGVSIGDTIASTENPVALPSIDINEPTVRMTIGASTSPFMGREGLHCTSRNLQDRLMRELRTNVQPASRTHVKPGRVRHRRPGRVAPFHSGRNDAPGKVRIPGLPARLPLPKSSTGRFTSPMKSLASAPLNSSWGCLPNTFPLTWPSSGTCGTTKTVTSTWSTRFLPAA